MRENLKDLCKKFVLNFNKSKEEFRFEMIISHALVSFLYLKEKKDINFEKIKKSKDTIKENTGVFSEFRGNGIFIESAKLALKENMEEEFLAAAKALEVFKKEFRFSRCASTISYFLGENRYKFDIGKAVSKGREVYKMHKKNHPFITGDEDILLSILLGINKEDIQKGVLDSEYYFGKLKPYLRHSEDIQRISNILALFDLDKNEVSNKVIKLDSLLWDEKYRLRANTLFVLPLLILLEDNIDKIKEDVIEVYNYLKENKIVGLFKLEKSYGIMFSALIVCLDYMNNNDGNNLKDSEILIINQITYIQNVIQDIILMNSIIVTSTIITSSNSN